MEEEKKDVEESESSTDKDSSAEDTAEKTTAVKEYEELQKRIAGLKAEEAKVMASLKQKREQRRSERLQPKAEESAQEQAKDEAGNDLTTADGWDKHIKETAKKSVEPVMSELERFKTRQREKAIKKFVADHPEYSADKDPDDERMTSLSELAKRIKGDISELDSEDYFEALKDAWAVQNRAQIEEQSMKLRQQKERADSDEADLATSSGASYERTENSSINATKSDLRSAHLANMPIEKYMKLKAQLEEMQV